MDSPMLPSREDFASRSCFDERSTVEAFYGKSLEEAQACFTRNFLWYSEQLSVLPGKPFSFYVLAATNYLRGASSAGDPDSVSSFCRVLEHRLNHPNLGLPVDALPNICFTIVAILGDFEKYGVDTEIYGNVIERYRALAGRVGA